MKIKEFKIGESFYTGSGKWICTDIGSRVIVAVKKGKLPPGPPYAVVEYVFDEYDMEGCIKNQKL